MTEPCGLHHVEGFAFCGPTAIAAITGQPLETVIAAVTAHRAKHGTPRRLRNRGAVVRSMFASEIAPVCEALGWRAEEHHGACMTFAQWQRVRKQAPYVVLVTGHFVAVSGHWFVDTRYREPIPLTRAPYRRMRVKRYWPMQPITGG